MIKHIGAKWGVWLATAIYLVGSGCQVVQRPLAEGELPVEFRSQNSVSTLPPQAAPRELEKVSLPPYVIEPPDILLIDLVKNIPKPPYRLESLDVLQVIVGGTLLEQPISGLYPIEPGGMLNLGPAYGSLKLGGLSVEEATLAIQEMLEPILQQSDVSVSLAQTAGQQQIIGEHLLGADGMVNLGTYGLVYVAGLRLDVAREKIEKHLETYLDSPKISLDVLAYNSKAYYVITDGAGQGDQVIKFPITGNETVLDAIAQVGGLTQLSSKQIWIARPAPGNSGFEQVLPVNWSDITRGGLTATNYQVLPGDRIFVAGDRLMEMSSLASKAIGPFERAFGFILLGSQALQAMQRFPRGFQRRSGGAFF